ncbi:poly(R)-hydroxyalkanoic acid synthase, class III, PhaC subunit [Neobacillus bataviensis LMG 21833]|uniref:Poly(R)-hydroxyalkanoic acid synthase, class III, PhaC subunit n=1 Tax=Neobacillus bataviensis LMG 21833 TaxID=1117379 RepID=K6D8C4_9BACI|nr:alpha/beta fold hydrolase [Neobacillus bataviensis]EKN68787.1 poly(R)-hydroxyalkanoic acid synthase, class III, PhaC subunit [Neobacillus bataviensis LMG 21833]
MAIESPFKEYIQELDVEKEKKRWEQLFKVFSEPEPKIGHTPRTEVWRKNKSVLWHYPAKQKKYEIPLFFVYSLFNKPYILDIAPKASVIEGLTNMGYEVYLLDWGSPGYEDKKMGLDTYIEKYLRTAVKRAIRHSGAEEITLIGYCLGGTIASIYASIADEPIKNLVVATVPIDFKPFIGPDQWAEGMRQGDINIDRFIDAYGVVPPQLVEGMFRAIGAPIYFTNYTMLLSRAHDQRYVDKWRRMNRWTRDQVPFAGEAYKQLANDLFKENKLVKGELMIGNKKVDLKNITANLYVVSGSRDNLILEEQSKPLMDLASSEDKTYVSVEAGHVSLALSGLFAKIVDQWASSRSNQL